MSRTRLALLLLVPAVVVVLAVGLTRSTNEGTEDPPIPESDIGTGEPLLHPVEESITVPAGAECAAAATTDEDPSCQAYQVLDTELAWLVDRDGGRPSIVSFLRRADPTTYVRVLRADLETTEFDTVNVLLDDLDGDGGVEAIFGFHRGNQLLVDVVEPGGTVVAHLDLGEGQLRVGDGVLVAFQRESDRWRRQEVRLVDGELEVLSTEVIEGPAEGNI